MQGAEVFLPMLPREAVCRGKRATLLSPLFPGYLFLLCEKNSVILGKVRSTRGARQLLRFGSELATVSAEIVEDLRTRCTMEQAESQIKPGQKVTIQSGPFSQYEAVFQEYDGDKRAIIFLTLLNQQQQLVMELNNLAVA